MLQVLQREAHTFQAPWRDTCRSKGWREGMQAKQEWLTFRLLPPPPPQLLRRRSLPAAPQLTYRNTILSRLAGVHFLPAIAEPALECDPHLPKESSQECTLAYSPNARLTITWPDVGEERHWQLGWTMRYDHTPRNHPDASRWSAPPWFPKVPASRSRGLQLAQGQRLIGSAGLPPFLPSFRK